jgi:superfamily II DNA/RNA helicase
VCSRGGPDQVLDEADRMLDMGFESQVSCSSSPLRFPLPLPLPLPFPLPLPPLVTHLSRTCHRQPGTAMFQALVVVRCFGVKVRSILANVRPDRQVLMFSATFRKRVEGLARDAVRNPIRITVGVVGQSNENVTQKVRRWAGGRPASSAPPRLCTAL